MQCSTVLIKVKQTLLAESHDDLYENCVMLLFVTKICTVQNVLLTHKVYTFSLVFSKKHLTLHVAKNNHFIQIHIAIMFVEMVPLHCIMMCLLKWINYMVYP